MENREAIIKNYIDGYNHFDIEKMVTDLDEDIVFENIQGGEQNMVINGLAEFKEQAEKATAYFSERSQRITALRHHDQTTEIEVDYNAILAVDLGDGMQKGQQLRLKGKSIFEFQNGKIVRLTDIS